MTLFISTISDHFCSLFSNLFILIDNVNLQLRLKCATGTMRLGKRRTIFTAQCLASRLYKPFHLPLQLQAGDLEESQEFKFVDERHRHRYEVNPRLVAELEQTGVAFVGQDESGERQEIIEIAEHPFFLAVQFHPEFLSRPNRPSPPFVGLLLAASGKLQQWLDVYQ